MPEELDILVNSHKSEAWLHVTIYELHKVTNNSIIVGQTLSEMMA